MTDKWKILRFYVGSNYYYSLYHLHKDKPHFVWLAENYQCSGFPDLIKYQCIGCPKKAPDYMINQWKLLNE